MERTPTAPWRSRFALALVALLFAARFDLWNQDSAAMWFGLPVGMAYHVAFCLLAVGALALLVRWAWPEGLIPEEPVPSETRTGKGDP